MNQNNNFKNIKFFTHKTDLLNCFFIGIFFFLLSFSLSRLISFDIYSKNNLFYGADFSRVISNAISIETDHSRMTSFHPFFSLIVMPISNLLLIFGVGIKNSYQIIVSFSGSLCGVIMYLTFRNLKIREIDAVLLVLAFSSSSAYIFWWSLPETFPLGGLTIVTSFYLLSTKSQSFYKWFITSFFTISISTTNFMVAIISMYFGKVKNFLKIISMTLITVLIFSYLQTFVIPSARWMLRGLSPWVSKNDIFLPNLNKIIDFFIFSFVSAKPVKAIANNGLDTISQYKDILDIKSKVVLDQLGIVNSYDLYQYFSALFVVIFIIWTFIILLSLISFFYNEKIQFQLSKVISKTSLFFIIGQFILHLIFGDMPFLFSAHFSIGFFIFISFIFTNNKFNKLGRCLIVSYILLALPWNINMFKGAIALALT